MDDDRRTEVVAHRTCPEHAPENSLLGIRRAAELGADRVEVDVRLSLEGRPVLVHDRTLRRTTGLPGPAFLWRESAIRAREIGEGERVPSFAEALTTLPDGLGLVVDVKVPRAVHPVLHEIAAHGAEDRVWIWSRHPSVVRFVADRHPAIEPSLQREPRTERGRRALLATATRSRAAGISTRAASLTSGLVAAVRDRGLRLYVRFDGTELDPGRLTGLDGVVVDRPEVARTALDAG